MSLFLPIEECNPDTHDIVQFEFKAPANKDVIEIKLMNGPGPERAVSVFCVSFSQNCT